MKIIRLFEDHMDQLEKETLKNLGLDAEIVVRPSKTAEEIIQHAQDADVIITIYESLTKEVLEQLPQLKLVVYRSIGFNNIDLAYANSIHLPVSHTARYCTEEVANYVAAAILAHNNRLFELSSSVKKDMSWNPTLYPIHRLSSQKVGLIAFGNIPRTLAPRLKAFGCEVYAYDPYVEDAVLTNYGVIPASLQEIFTNCDYISSHLPLNPETKGMLDQSLFDLMKQKPVFINSSRGGVVKEAELIQALDDGKFSAAFLDVLESENPDLDHHPLMQMANVVLTPHAAYYSEEALEQAVIDTLKNIQAFYQKNYEAAEIVNLADIDLQA